jgi:hypothetical protein
MEVEDERSALLLEKDALESMRDFIEHQKSNFKSDISHKESQLQRLVDKKQAELEDYEACLREEARSLTKREERIELAESELVKTRQDTMFDLAQQR